jgi:hypothetical protein
VRFDQLSRGQIGDNLMYKYRAIASFFLWREICQLAFDATRRLVCDNGAAGRMAGFDELWSDLHTYVYSKHAASTDIEELMRPVEARLRHDIAGWLSGGAPAETGPWRFSDLQSFIFRLSSEGAREMEAALSLWSPKAIGLSKLITRIRYTAQVRECEPAYSQ